MNRCPHAERSPRAFTLIELLATIAIMALLLVAAVPALRAARDSGLASRSSSNLRQLALANLAYAADNGTFAPAQDAKNRTRWHGARTGGTGAFDPRKGYLAPYLGEDKSVKRCPLLTNLMESGSFEEGTGGYGYNAAYVGGTPDDPFTPEKPSGIPHASATIMFATTAFARGGGLQEYPYAEPFFFTTGGGTPQPSVHFRAHGRAIVAWCDGHVTSEPPTKVGGPNYYGGDNGEHQIGWLGPEEENGFWNPRRGL